MNGLIANLLGMPRAREDRQSGYEMVAEVLRESREASAGVSVTAESALGFSAVFACARILAETVGSLPLIVYERQGKWRDRARNHYLYPILHDAPNEMMTAIEFRETVQGYLALRGNAICQIVYNSKGQVSELWPLRWENVHQVRVDRGTGKIYYYYQLPDGGMEWLSSDSVWHLRGWGSDGIVGYSPVSLARRTIGLGIAAEEFGTRFFANDARPGVVMEHPGQLGPEAYKRLKDSWEDTHKGVTKSHRIAILEEGLKLHEIGIPPEDAQFLETRIFQVRDVARWFRMQPHMLQDLERATFSNIEHLGIDFVVHTMRSWFVRWEQSIAQNLMTKQERERYYVEFLVDGLLRGDTATRYAAYAQGIQAGWFTRADAREKENLDPIAGLEKPLVPMNMYALGEAPAASTEAPKEPTNPTGVSPTREEQRDVGRLDEQGRREAARRRYHIAKSYKRLLQDAAERVFLRESTDIIRAIEKYLKKGDEGSFDSWMEKYYAQTKDTIVKIYKPVFYGLGEAINAAAASEVGGPVGFTLGLEECIDYHIDRAAKWQIDVSQRQIAMLRTQGSTLDEIATLLIAALGLWVDERSPAMAAWESVRISGLMTKATYFFNDVDEIEWVQMDENPFCETLDGNRLHIGDSCRGTHFKLKTDEIVIDRGERSKILSPSWNVSTPPLFMSCECQIAAINKKRI